MKITKFQLIRKLIRNESGQSIAVFIVILFGLMALAASGVETGHVYYAYRLLQASTRTATLAAAQAMPDIGSNASATVGTAYGNLDLYSSESGDKSANSILKNDTITANFYCSTTMEAANVGCETPPSGEGSCTTGTTCNAVKVTQTASVNLWFGGFVGLRTMSLTATASAAMRGGADTPYNIAVVMDTTESMNDTAKASLGCSGATQIQCAVSGLSSMLQTMDPCPLNETCPGNANYVDDVALFVFPAIAAGYTNDDTQCPTKNPPIVPYAFPVVTPGSTQNLILPSVKGQPDAGTYEVAAFEDSYRANDSANGLYSGDGLAAAVGVGSGSCKGLQAPGGEGTYYAQVIYAAQSALEVAQTSNPNSVNVMIILSDGNAGACNTGANTAAGGCTSSNQIVSLSGILNGTGTAKTNAGGYTSPVYPSALGECGQAVQAAQLATQAGTKVYTIAMGSPTSGGCTTDRQYTTPSGSTYGAEAWPSGSYSRQPCNAIGAMASNTTTFYSDNTGGCAATGGNAVYTTIAGIFHAVGNSLTSSRLIPYGTS